MLRGLTDVNALNLKWRHAVWEDGGARSKKMLHHYLQTFSFSTFHRPSTKKQCEHPLNGIFYLFYEISLNLRGFL